MASQVALPLFDVMRWSATQRQGRRDGFAAIAQRFVDAALDEYRHLDGIDRSARPDEDAPFDRNTAILLRHAYDQWATHAEGLLQRLAALKADGGAAVQRAGELTDAVGRTRAMLSVTLEDLDRAEEQISRGETVPLEEVRRELLARSQRQGADGTGGVAV